MKVTGGQAKGKKIFIPKGAPVRATSDRTKESLFNILPSMEGELFLDLFAGTGNIGIEALSRGAAKVVFVEKNNLLIKAIKKNLSLCGFNDQYELIPTAVENGIQLLAKREEKFDVIFADPPYEKQFMQKTLDSLSRVSLVSGNGIIVIEHSHREAFEENNCSFILRDQRKYGDTMISFFKINNERLPWGK